MLGLHAFNCIYAFNQVSKILSLFKKKPISKIKCVNYTIHIMPVLITLSNSLQGVTEWEPSQALEQVF